MTGFRRLYGSHPLHLLAHLGVFFIAGWAIDQIAQTPTIVNWIVWFLGAALLHDLVLLPLYSLANRGLEGARGNQVARGTRRRPRCGGHGRPTASRPRRAGRTPRACPCRRPG